MRSIYSTLFLISSLLVLSGCGNGFTVHPVKGKVTLDGNPLEGAVVTFDPSGNGKAAMGRTDASGTYTLVDMRPEAAEGAEVGSYTVTIHWIPPAAVDLSQATGNSTPYDAKAADKERQVTSKNAPKTKLPNDYSSSATSGLKAEVKSGKNEIDFPLKSDYKASK